jgi:hypothetical protein
MGYRGQVLNRVSYTLKNKLRQHGPSFFWYRVENPAAPFHFDVANAAGGQEWVPVVREEEGGGLWTVVLPDHYSSPHPLRFVEVVSRAQDAKHFQSIADATQAYVRGLSTAGCEGVGPGGAESEVHVLLLVGDDFAHRHAERSFDNLDRIIKAFNSKYSPPSLRGRPMITTGPVAYRMAYSTPSKYFSACAQLNLKSSKKSNKKDTIDDTSNVKTYAPFATASGHLLPYSDNYVNDWTGYYGSRPLLKHKIR